MHNKTTASNSDWRCFKAKYRQIHLKFCILAQIICFYVFENHFLLIIYRYYIRFFLLVKIFMFSVRPVLVILQKVHNLTLILMKKRRATPAFMFTILIFCPVRSMRLVRAFCRNAYEAKPPAFFPPCHLLEASAFRCYRTSLPPVQEQLPLRLMPWHPYPK